MAVNLSPPCKDQLLPVAGIALGIAQAGIRKADRDDLLLIAVAEHTRVAGIFTRNRFCAAPVVVARRHLHRHAGIRALLINTGNANAGTGEPGLRDAERSCREVARLLGIAPEQVLPFSTGVIMEPLPLDRILNSLPKCVSDLRADNWWRAAHAIMTTDTVAKALSRRIRIGEATITITGIAKGAGMIHPDMATMLAFIATDANVPTELLQRTLHYAAERSFNAITVDGDTSTNDALIGIATGQSAAAEIIDASSAAYAAFRDAFSGVAQLLAQAIVRDGEGASKLITVRIERGASVDECRKVAFAIAHSPLVKTAFFASDPNLGRILAAIGYAGIDDLDVGRVSLYLDDVLVAQGGARHPEYRESDGQRVMQQSEITVRVVLDRGSANATIWTCDLSHDYVTINAEYRT